MTNQYEIISVGFSSQETFLPRGNFHARSRTSLALISLTDENFGTTRSLTGISSTKNTFFPPRVIFLARGYFQAVSRNSHIPLSLRKMRRFALPKIHSPLRQSHSSRAAILTPARLIRSFYHLLGKWGTTRSRLGTLLSKKFPFLPRVTRSPNSLIFTIPKPGKVRE